MKISKLLVTGLCAGNSPEVGEFPAQMANYAENASIWRRHHVVNHLPIAVRADSPALWRSLYYYHDVFLIIIRKIEHHQISTRFQQKVNCMLISCDVV